MTKRFDLVDYTYKVLIIIGIAITAAVMAKDIVIPLLIAAFLAIVLSPVVNWFQKKLSATISIIIVLILAFLLIVGTFWAIADQLTSLVQDLPNLENKFTALIEQGSNKLQTLFNIDSADQNQMIKEALKEASTYITGFLVSTTSTISLFIQIPIYIFLFLLYRTRFKKFFISILPATEESTWRQDIETVLQGYISGLLLVTLIIATLNTIGLAILGIDHAIFFGVFAGLLTVIPYVGIFIGATLPTIFALLTKDSIWYTVGVVSLFSAVQFIEGNFISPRITGSKVSINALAAIVALLIGGKILGIAGMILAVPITGVLKVVLAYTNHLKPFAILLGDANGEEEKAKKETPAPPPPDESEEV